MIYTIPGALSVREVGEEVFVIDRRNSTMHTFNGTGACLWKQLARGVAADLLAERICEVFDVDRARAETDVVDFLNACEDRNLITLDR